jgi:hypothetical protein
VNAPIDANPGGASHGQTGDRAGAVALLIVSGVIAMALAFAGLMLVMSSDGCGSSGTGSCNYSVFTISWLASMLAPVLGWAATLVVTIVRLSRDKSAWWVPIAGTAAFTAVFAGAVALAFWSLS